MSKFDHIPLGSRGDDGYLERARLTDPHLVFVMERSCNKDIVVYGAKLDPKGELVRSSPADVFWRVVLKNYIRQELGYLDKNVAYGVRDKHVIWNPKDYGFLPEPYGTHDMAEITMVALPKRVMFMIKTGENTWSIFGMHSGNGIVIKIHRMWIQVKDSFIPGVDFIDIVGHDLEGNTVVERIIP